MDPKPPNEAGITDLVSNSATSPQGLPSVSISSGPILGPVFTTVYVERKVRAALVQENELEYVGLLNNLFAGACSLGTAFAFKVVDVLISASTTDSAGMTTMGYWMLVLCILLAGGCFVFAGFAAHWRNQKFEKIFNQSRSI